MSRIQTCLSALAAQGRRALIPYITAGYPYPNVTPTIMHEMVKGGADIIELGVPFSDPMADGPVIQKAGESALRHGIGMQQVLDMVKTFRAEDAETPVVLMGYANPIERFDGLHGQRAFVNAAKAAGVDGILVVDYPPEECESFATDLRAQDMDLIFLLAPTSTDERMALVGKLATGYVYYVSLAGVTGSGALNVDAVAERLPLIREKTGLPVGVGFGIRDAATAARIARIADAVVVGSRIIEEIEKSTADNACANVKALVADIRHGVDEVKA